VTRPWSLPNLNTKTPVNKTNNNIYMNKTSKDYLLLETKTKLKTTNEKGKKELVE
jgi:hypothetical protein